MPVPPSPAPRPKHILNKRYRHDTVPLCLGPTLGTLRAMCPTLDTGSGLNLIRVQSLPRDWQDHAVTRQRKPKVMNASGNPLRILAAIDLIVDTGDLKLVSTFNVVKGMAVPAIQGTASINAHVEAIFPRLRKVQWAAGTKAHPVCLPILRTNAREAPPAWAPAQAKVKLAKGLTIPAKSEHVA